MARLTERGIGEGQRSSEGGRIVAALCERALRREKNSTTPRAAPPSRMGNAVAARSPALDANAARTKLGCSVASLIQDASPLCQTCPSTPRPRVKVVSRHVSSNSRESTSGPCQMPWQRSRSASRSTIQNAPHAQSMPSPMACSTWGVACARVPDSARACVTACSVDSRCSARLRSCTSFQSALLTAVNCLVRSATRRSSCSAARRCSPRRRASWKPIAASFAAIRSSTASISVGKSARREPATNTPTPC